MDVGEGPSRASQTIAQDTIQAGCTILLKLPSGDIRTLKLEKDSYADKTFYFDVCIADLFSRTISLGKFGSFHSNELIGQPYGLTYNIVDKKLNIAPPRTMQDVGRTIV